MFQTHTDMLKNQYEKLNSNCGHGEAHWYMSWVLYLTSFSFHYELSSLEAFRLGKNVLSGIHGSCAPLRPISEETWEVGQHPRNHDLRQAQPQQELRYPGGSSQHLRRDRQLQCLQDSGCFSGGTFRLNKGVPEGISDHCGEWGIVKEVK